MIRTYRQVIVGCLGLLALSGSACSRIPNTVEAQEKPKPEKPPKAMSGCATRFAISAPREGRTSCALLPQDSPKWKIVSLHPENDQYRDVVWSTTKAASPFCVYEWTGARNPTPPDFKALGAQAECALAAAMGTTDPPAAELAALAETFRRQARGMAPSPVTAKATLDKAYKPPVPTTKVAVVDATPFGPDTVDTSGHGNAVSRVITATACGSDANNPACAAMIKPYLALPLVKRDGTEEWVENPKGGYIGYFHHLFRAFDRALTEWERGKPKKGEHLIINLSLGWDPIKTDPDSLEVKTMKELLARAYCDGVLVIAAAGNDTGSEGPVLPAALESEEPPNTVRCKDLDRTLSPSLARSRAYRPQIHSVGAVDQYDERLVTSRPWGQPRLAAYGIQVSIEAPGGYTPMFTGSSISAAITSGIAAVIWSLMPDKEAPEVMAMIYDGGVQLDYASGHPRSRTEYCIGHPKPCDAWPVRRVSLCGALKKAGKHLECLAPLTRPALKEVHVTPKDPIEPCRVAHCGIPVGPNEIQLPEAVLPMPGAANCPACQLTLGTLLGRVVGTVHGTADVVPPNLTATVVRTYANASSFQDYSLTPMPKQNVSFTNAMFMSTRPTSAEIRWTYNNGISTVIAVTPLGMN